MVDINGVELVVGDSVVYTNRNLNELHKGKVARISKTKLVIKYSPDKPLSYLDNVTGKTISWIAKYEHNIMSSDQIMKLG